MRTRTVRVPGRVTGDLKSRLPLKAGPPRLYAFTRGTLSAPCSADLGSVLRRPPPPAERARPPRSAPGAAGWPTPGLRSGRSPGGRPLQLRVPHKFPSHRGVSLQPHEPRRPQPRSRTLELGDRSPTASGRAERRGATHGNKVIWGTVDTKGHFPGTEITPTRPGPPSTSIPGLGHRILRCPGISILRLHPAPQSGLPRSTGPPPTPTRRRVLTWQPRCLSRSPALAEGDTT